MIWKVTGEVLGNKGACGSSLKLVRVPDWENSQTRVDSKDAGRVWRQNFSGRAPGAWGWDQQHVSPEGGSSSWLPLCAEHLHGTIKKAAEGLWPRHEIHLGIQTLPGLPYVHTWACCHFCTNPASTNLFSSGSSDFVDIDGDCISCLPIK